MSYRSPNIQAYRKVLSPLKLRPVEGTMKTVLVKEGLVNKKMDRYCLPRAIASQVIQDIHLYHMHLGIDGIVQQAQKCIWMPGLYSVVRRELTQCVGCMQKHKLQNNMRVEHCFYMKEKGSAAQIVHLDLAGLLDTRSIGKHSGLYSGIIYSLEGA